MSAKPKAAAINNTSLAPLNARAVPRLARTQKGGVFVQLCGVDEVLPGLAWEGITGVVIIVQNYADLCKEFVR
ncbi:hypothetical protein Phpb_02665 [Photorhabdus namnaonensis]|uniref:Uncharacterized protein n=1 Tax=Photorhabdus namnaonensis TaxID=1851568 RepID=A0A1B8YGF7_9GAMM|nr:hypothetical protein Phpb_02665 [Photorhabdus namnaonensis]